MSVEVEYGHSSGDPLLDGGPLDASVVRAYMSDSKAPQLLGKAIRTVGEMVDGSWQDLSGKLGIAPTLDRNPYWASEYQDKIDKFQWGPEFFMGRREVIDLREERSKRKSILEPQIVVALGGSDFGGNTRVFIGAFSEIGLAAKADVFVKDLKSWDDFPAHVGPSVEFHDPGSYFPEYLASADLAVTAAGTTVAEISFLGVKAILISVVANQEESAQALRALKVGAVLSSDQADFPAKLIGLLREALLSSAANPYRLIDSKGAQRVAEIITSSMLSNGKTQRICKG